MRLERYITEMDFGQRSDEWHSIVKPTLAAKCKPFLKEKVLLYRGTRDFDESLKLMRARTDRKPMDSSYTLHDSFDIASNKVFGWKARSESVFASPHTSMAAGYGTVTPIFPKGNFRYIWSPMIKDLFEKWRTELQYNGEATSGNPTFWKEFVEKNYQNNHMRKSTIDRGTEVMLYCPNGYYLVHPDYTESLKKEFKLP